MQKFFNWFAGIILVNIVVLNKLDWDFTPIAVVLVCGLMFVAGLVSLISKQGFLPPIAWAFVLAPLCIGELGALEVFHPNVPVMTLVILFASFVVLFGWKSKFMRVSGW